MLQIKTHLGKSIINGIGVFTLEFIPKGKVIWIYHPCFTSKISIKKINKLTSKERERLDFLSYYWINTKGDYMIPLDHDRFMNHSREANTHQINVNIDVASIDIQPFEELTVDYRTIYPEEMWKPYF